MSESENNQEKEDVESSKTEKSKNNENIENNDNVIINSSDNPKNGEISNEKEIISDLNNLYI